MLSNLVTSVIRTVVPTIIGAVLAALAKQGLSIDQAEVSAWLVPVLISAYYTVVRALEIKYPSIGWLLGVPKSPGYAAGSVPPAQPSPGPNPDL